MDEREQREPALREPASREPASREPARQEPVRRDTAPTTRSQSVVHFIERSHDHAARLLSGLLERAGEPGAPRFVVVVPTADDALALNEALAAQSAAGSLLLTPVSSVSRGRRLLAAGAVAIAGSPSELSALIAQSLLPMSGLQTLVLVWPEEVLSDERLALLESILSEVPRTAERVAIVGNRIPELGQFMERAMWRAREVDHATGPAAPATAIVRLIAAAPAERVRVLRSVLDALDPERAVLVANTDEGEAAARDAIALLGGSAQDDLLHVSRGVPEGRFSLAVLFDDVVSTEILAGIAGTADDVVALVRPSRVAAFRKLAGTVLPFTWSGAVAAARSVQDTFRDEVRGTVASGAHMPWINVIEPLLDELDPVEIAAAAAALLDRERRRARRAVAPAQVAAEAAPREARPAGRGARPGPRRDEERGGSSFARKRPGEFGARGKDAAPRGRPSRDRGERSGPPRDRGERGSPRGGARDEARPGQRGARDDIERMPRAAREGVEWSERGERLRNSRRGPRGGEGR